MKKESTILVLLQDRPLDLKTTRSICRLNNLSLLDVQILGNFSYFSKEDSKRFLTATGLKDVSLVDTANRQSHLSKPEGKQIEQALENCTTPYVHIINNGDRLAENSESLLLKKAEETNADVVTCRMLTFFFSTILRLEIEGCKVSPKDKLNYFGHELALYGNKLYRTDYLKQFTFPNTSRWSNSPVNHIATLLGHVEALQEPLYYKNALTSDVMTGNHIPSPSILDVIENTQNMEENLRNLGPDNAAYFEKLKERQLLSCLLRMEDITRWQGASKQDKIYLLTLFGQMVVTLYGDPRNSSLCMDHATGGSPFPNLSAMFILKNDSFFTSHWSKEQVPFLKQQLETYLQSLARKNNAYPQRKNFK